MDLANYSQQIAPEPEPEKDPVIQYFSFLDDADDDSTTSSDSSSSDNE